MKLISRDFLNGLISSRVTRWLLTISPLILFLYIFIINYSADDDSYITFRTVDNFVHGFGLRWNLDDRVMVNVHPLWMFLVAGIFAISNNLYLSVFFISLLLSLAAVLIVFYKSKDSITMLMVGLLVCSSKAFMDYAGTGLENPLSYFLGLLFVVRFMAFYEKEPDDNSVFVLFLLGGLNFLTRYDTVLFFIPPLLYVLYICWKNNRLPVIHIFAGLIPALAWYVFAFIYYGFLFPNVYYAKQNIHYSIMDFILQGLTFYKYSFLTDPVTILVIIAACIYIIIDRIKNKKAAAVFVGIVFYLLYIIKIGGTYMTGRFFSMPFMMSLLIIIYLINIKKLYGILLSLLLIVYQIYMPYVPIKACTNFIPMQVLFYWNKANMADEHCFYHSCSNILKYSRDKRPFPEHKWARKGVKLSRSKPSTSVIASVGYYGYFSGPKIILIDNCGLTDPLLSHIQGYPFNLEGHNYRFIPAGYVESRVKGTNLIKDAELKKYYEKIRVITTGELFTTERWKYIFELNFTKNKYYKKNYEPESEDKVSSVLNRDLKNRISKQTN